MDHAKEFKKYAIQHHGINSLYYNQLVSSMTPYIICLLYTSDAADD